MLALVYTLLTMISCDDCPTESGPDVCECGVCGSYGHCSFSCVPDSGRIECIRSVPGSPLPPIAPKLACESCPADPGPDVCHCGVCGSYGHCTFSCIPDEAHAECIRSVPAAPPSPPNPAEINRCGMDTPRALVGLNLAGVVGHGCEQWGLVCDLLFVNMPVLSECPSMVEAIKNTTASQRLAFRLAMVGYDSAVATSAVATVSTLQEPPSEDKLIAEICTMRVAVMVGMARSWDTVRFPGSQEYVADLCPSTCAAYEVYSLLHDCSPCGQQTCSLSSPSMPLSLPPSPPPTLFLSSTH